ncbi:MAG: HEAT repeat domain-containing protein [Lentisphaerae bacterium]|nr:HEAT repeat domain-containing protein [Lentisphaerota bacterium]
MRCASLFGLLLLAMIPPAVAAIPQARTMPKAATPSSLVAPQIWHDSLKLALTKAAAEYQPVLAVFSSPDCPWCLRLKEEMLRNPDTQTLLRHFALVEINVALDPKTAAAYQIEGVPVVMILSGNGDPQSRVVGYLSQPDLQRLLKDALNPEFLRRQDVAYNELLKWLADQQVPAGKWPDIMVALGAPEKRKPLRDAILKLTPFPRQAIVGLLENRRLAVRLGALDLLEEITGDSYGFDPWTAPASPDNRSALSKWAAWAGSAQTNAVAVFAALTPDQIASYARDLISENPDRALRARQMLRHGGPSVADALAAFLEDHRELTPAAVKAVKEAQYAALLADVDGIDPDAVAHRLMFGTLDIRQKSILELPPAGAKTTRLLRDYLDDPDPLIREAAVDALVASGAKGLAGVLEQRLNEEKDQDVVCAILRNLGRVKSKKGLALLITYSAHSNEDLAITALNSMTRLKAKTTPADEIAKRLDDPRWRVRVAALEVVGAVKMNTLTDKVTLMLKDADDFTRLTAVKTLAEIAARKSAPRLEETFLREDDLKGPIVSAYVRMELAVPESFLPALAEKSPDVLLAVLEAMDDDNTRHVKLAVSLMNHDNLDVACAAIRIAAKYGSKDAAVRAQLIAVLKTGKREMKLAVLENIPTPERKDLVSKNLVFLTTRGASLPGGLISPSIPSAPSATAGSASNAATLMDSLLSDFADTGAIGAPAASGAPPVPATPPPPAKGPSADDIFTAFLDSAAPPTMGVTTTAPGSSTGAPVARGSMEELLKAVETLLASSDDPELRFQSALLLTRYGSPAAAPVLQAGLAERPVEERQAVAAALARVSDSTAIPCLRQLLGDPAESVRRMAGNSCCELGANSAALGVMFEEILRSGSPLKPHELYDYPLTQLVREIAAKQPMAKWARRLVTESLESEPRIFGLALLETCGGKDDEKSIRPFLQSQDPFLRRAAYHALGRLNLAAFTNLADAAAADPSEYVRMAIPAVYNRSSPRWFHYFSQEHFSDVSDYSRSYSSGDRRSGALPPGVEALLFRLTTDESPKVRVEAFFCLLANRKAVNLEDFVRTLDAFPDRKEIRSRVAEYVMSNYESLGKNFGILLRFIDEERGGNEMQERMRKHFGLEEDEEAPVASAAVRALKPRETTATFLKTPEPAAHPETRKLTLVFFNSPGCSDCARVEKLLPGLKDVFPWLEVETHDSRKVSAMRLNETLSEKFGVPENLRLVAPAVFAAGGFLIKKDITFDRLAELLARSAALSGEDWRSLPDAELSAADQTIFRRYEAFSPLLVAGSGLLDGVNPCAFATLIFLVSYLQVTRKKARETAQVAIAFISGVFLAYLGLGLGLIEVIARLLVLKSVGVVLNWGLAAFALVLMALNVRDGIYCLQGRLRDTALQLPGFLKQATHAVIRHGARHRHFVAAAFLTGIVISFLELACTGQVYAPTLGFIVNTRGLTPGALGLLLLYNVAFIVPLIVVFALVFFGMTAEGLTRLLQRHAAAVKFGTAGLFLVLFLLFVWSLLR